MSMMKVMRLTDTATTPVVAHDDDAGYDLFSSEELWILPGETEMVPTGLAIQLPDRYSASIRGRSGLNSRGIFVALGLVDAGYRGEWMVVVHNSSTMPFHIPVGTKIAQFTLAKVPEVGIVEVTELDDSERGSGGFGSTGV